MKKVSTTLGKMEDAKLNQVFLNILNNAIDAMETGGTINEQI
jgi:signal transduction histidine kinase